VRNGNDKQRSIAEVRASLEQSTLDLRAALERLELGARAKIDIGRRIARKASTVLFLGFLAGMVLGLATARPPGRRW
jgi:hypothetical protein